MSGGGSGAAGSDAGTASDRGAPVEPDDDDGATEGGARGAKPDDDDGANGSTGATGSKCKRWQGDPVSGRRCEACGLLPEEHEPERDFDGEDLDGPACYRIVRFYSHGRQRRRIIKRGLTLREAQAHCSDPSTSGGDFDKGTAWFDGYEMAR